MVRRGAWHWICKEWTHHRWHIVEALGAVATAVGAIWIPIILDSAADQRHETEVETRTLQVMNDINREIAKILSDQPHLRRQKGEFVEANFTYESITQNDGVNAAVIRLLNEYDYVCLGGNKNLLNPVIMKDLRGHAIQATWRLYKNYIVTYRTKNDPNAWDECDTWLKKNYPTWKW